MSDYTEDLGLSPEEAVVIDRDFAAISGQLAAAKVTIAELRHRMVDHMIRNAYREARLDAVHTVLYEAEEQWRDDDLHAEAYDIVKLLRHAEADVRRRWEAEFGEQVEW